MIASRTDIRTAGGATLEEVKETVFAFDERQNSA